MERLLAEQERQQYREGWRERARRRAAALEQTKKQASKRVRDAARLAREKYGVRRTVLFGSLATGVFREDSDVDLCVEGLGSQGLYYPLYGDLERMLLPLRLHLVLWEDLTDSGADRALRQGIEATGVELS